ncbi:MAG: N-6 DNA methylase [Myxococcota bacterium]
MSDSTTSEVFAASLRAAEDRLRAVGFSGRNAYAALCRDLAKRLKIPEHLWLDGPDAPEEARLDRIPLTTELDLFGLTYERFFPEVFKAERGQYFTPRPLVELMADLAEIRPGDRVLDPTCGSGTFLVVAHGRGADVDGVEVDPELVALCRLNLALHGANPRSVEQADLFRQPAGGTWDVILANPPFSVRIDHPDALRRFSLAQGRARVASDTLFLQAAHDRLRPGGRLAVVLPRSILANESYSWLRQWVQARFVRRAIVSLPEGVFRPFGGTTARAAVLVLEKHPAALQPWAVGIIEHPGYDPSRKNYRKTEQDDLSTLRIDWKNKTLPVAPSHAHSWVPETILGESTIPDDVPVLALEEIAPLAESQSFRPSDTGNTLFTEIDLADVDKRTGEVSGARLRAGTDFNGSKTPFAEGDLLFARMRPSLNNVVIAQRPHPDLPTEMCGSSEWVRLAPIHDRHFALIAARSSFVRNQLKSTGGQTRPRIKADDLPDLLIPDPGLENRNTIDRIVENAMNVRLNARRQLDAVAALYEQYGRGEIDERALSIALSKLS